MKEENVVVVCGLDSAGKSTIISTINTGDFFPKSRTIGFDLASIFIEDATIKTYDLGGQESFRKLWKDHIPIAKLIIFVIDSADQKRLKEAKNEFMTNVLGHSQKNTPIILLCNKQDLEEALSGEEIIKRLKIDKLEEMKNHELVYFETSALTAQGLFEFGKWVYEKLTGKLLPKIETFNNLEDLI